MATVKAISATHFGKKFLVIGEIVERFSVLTLINDKPRDAADTQVAAVFSP
ncbi:hypothetical protein [Litorivicinus lipolyticus]|uniref:hypothetical protein n=1 Tax=Litorivicinus lipolyticus TaxID=418701 RepID=UPI003B5C5FBB